MPSLFPHVFLPIRVLFAEYFNPKNIYSLLGRLRHRIGGNIEITVIANAETIKEIKHAVFSCVNKGDIVYPVIFIEMALRTYVQSSLAEIKKNK